MNKVDEVKNNIFYKIDSNYNINNENNYKWTNQTMTTIMPYNSSTSNAEITYYSSDNSENINEVNTFNRKQVQNDSIEVFDLEN